MAEAFLNHLAGERFQAQSAGLEPGTLNPLAVLVMKESGIDISNNQTKSVTEFIERGESFDYVITVCDEANAERCPAFPCGTARIHWSFADPADFKGSYEERLKKTRKVRDQIKAKIVALLKSHPLG